MRFFTAQLQAAALVAAAAAPSVWAFGSLSRQRLSGGITSANSNHRCWATKEAVTSATSTATKSLSPDIKEELSVFQAPDSSEDENASTSGKLCIVYGSEARAALEERGWEQVEDISFVSSADEVSALLDAPDADNAISDADKQELGIALTQALVQLYKSEEERFEAIQTLVNDGACIKRTKSMMRAAADQYQGGKNLKVLLELGGSVEDRDAYGSTALHIACVFCNADGVDVLIENGADATAKDDDGLTPKDVFARTVERNKEIKEEYGYGSEDDRLREDRIQAILDKC